MCLPCHSALHALQAGYCTSLAATAGPSAGLAALERGEEPELHLNLGHHDLELM